MAGIRETHWTVRATCVLLGLGSVLGIVDAIIAMGSATAGSPAAYVIVVLVQLALGSSAVGLWFGEGLGLRAMRLLVLAQIPIVQSASFSYLFYTGAVGALYGGSRFGLQGWLGSTFNLQIHPGATSGGDHIAGVNLLAIAMFAILSRVDLMPFDPAPPPPFE